MTAADDRPAVLLTPHWREMNELFSVADQARLRTDYEVIWGKDEPMPPGEFEAALPNAEYYVSATQNIDRQLLDSAPKLKAVIEVSGSFPSTIDYGACADRGVEVLSCAPGFQRAVAEMALGMAIAGGRGLVAEHEGFRDGSEAWLSDCVNRDFTLYGAKVGFIGFGAIARETARLLGAFGVRLMAFDPYLPRDVAEEWGLELVELDEVARSCRCIFVCASPTRENKGLLSEAFFAAMQQSALLVVISRAHLVDFDALTEAVGGGHISAAIDVFPDEPLAADHPIRSMKGTILSPHRAAAVKGGRQMIGELVLADLGAMSRGQSPAHLTRATPDLVRLVAGVGEDEPVSSIIPRGES